MRDSDNDLYLRAPAKVNLGLEIVRQRMDGYHDINSLFATVGVFDEIRLSRRSDSRITCRVEGSDVLESDDRNLAVRAAIKLRELSGRDDLGLDILLEKMIPIGAGLGGGSSDAASVLMGAARIWGLDVALDSLHTLALELGSDVPFFLLGGIALASSRGEILHPVEFALPYHILLVNPGIHISTPWAYRAIGRTGERTPSDLRSLLQQGISTPSTLRTGIVNDFELPVFTEHPLLARLKKELYRAGAILALMSGSGSTLFALFETSTQARVAAERFPEYWTAMTTIIYHPAGLSVDI